MKPERIQESWTTLLPGWQFEQSDRLCRSFVFEHPHTALDFVIGLCRLTKQYGQNLSFRARDGHVFVQGVVPTDGADESLLELAKALDDLRADLP